MFGLKKLRIALLILVQTIPTALISTGCSSSPSPQQSTEKKEKILSFTLPTIPSNLTSPTQRGAYLADHYWDHFDFADTAYIAKAEITEQAFSDYVNILPHIQKESMERSIKKLIELSARDSLVHQHFIELTEKYLYDPNSPFRNERYYLPALYAIISSQKIDTSTKIRYQYQLEMVLKNRVGDIATDFEFTLKGNKKMKLHDLNNFYTILFFNNPDCSDCKRVKEHIAQSPDLNQKGIEVASIYIDEDIALWQNTAYPSTWINGYASELSTNNLYDLRAIPTLYLLDSQKRVVLKDATIEQTEEWIKQNVRQYVVH